MTSKILVRRMATALAAVMFGHPPLVAAEPLPAPLRICASIQNDTERLACYDAAVSHIESGTAAPSPENMFGASAASRPPAPKPEAKAESRAQEAPPEDLRQISGKVVAIGRSDGGMPVLTLDNDQVWRQQDADAALTVEIGDSVTITRASLGTFRLTDKRGRSARFRRLR